MEEEKKEKKVYEIFVLLYSVYDDDSTANGHPLPRYVCKCLIALQ